MCFKKSLRVLMTVTKENPQLADWWREMENKYAYKRFDKDSDIKNTFYRDRMSIDDIIEESKFPFKLAEDKSKGYDTYKQMMMWDNYLDSNGGCTESCEVF